MSFFALALMLQASCDLPNQIGGTYRSCLAEKLEIAELQLEQALRVVREKAQADDAAYQGGGPTWISVLNKSQAKWREYRDLECESQSMIMRPGNGTATVELDCRLEKTLQRLAEVKELAVNE